MPEHEPDASAAARPTRRALLAAAAAGQAPDAAQSARSDAHLEWIRGFYSDVYASTGGVPDPSRDPSGTVQGCYVNYPDADLGTHDDGRAEQALRLYFGPNLRDGARSLVSVKSRWDPSNVFRHAQSVPVS